MATRSQSWPIWLKCSYAVRKWINLRCSRKVSWNERIWAKNDSVSQWSIWKTQAISIIHRAIQMRLPCQMSVSSWSEIWSNSTLCSSLNKSCLLRTQKRSTLQLMITSSISSMQSHLKLTRGSLTWSRPWRHSNRPMLWKNKRFTPACCILCSMNTGSFTNTPNSS